MKKYVVNAIFIDDKGDKLTVDFSLLTDDLSFSVIDQSLAIIMDEYDIDGLRQLFSYELICFSISTF